MKYDTDSLFIIGVNGDIIHLDDHVRIKVTRNGVDEIVDGEVIEISNRGSHFIVQLDDGDIVYAAVSQIQPDQEK